MIKFLFTIVAVAAAIAIAGCGGGGNSGSGPASLAPPQTAVFVEGTLRPTGKLKSNVEALARNVAGIDDLGGKIVAELESSARGKGTPLDFEGEVKPWLGDNAAIFLEDYDGKDFKGYGVLLETTNPNAAQRFVDRRAKASKEPHKEASYEGVGYTVDTTDGTAVGVVGDFVVVGKDEKAFKDAVTASNGDSLAGEDGYSNVASEKAPGSLATVYADVGCLIEEAEGQVDSQTLQLLEGAGIDPSHATALASVVPGSETVEIEISGDFGGEGGSIGKAPKMLESLPADSVVALSGTGFGERLEEAVDKLDAEGIPGSVPPHQLKNGLKSIGIDLEAIAGSIGEVGVFATGTSQSNLAGAAVLTTDGSGQATKVIASIGTLLRAANTPGVTAVTGKASGFSIHSPRLGRKPLVVAAKGGRIAIGYGLPATLQGLNSASGATLGGTPAFKRAAAALGETPIGGFVDGPTALPLAELLVPPSAGDFQKAKPYLKKIEFVALGSVSPGELKTVKAIVGFEK
jgi:hypothetical protein